VALKLIRRNEEEDTAHSFFAPLSCDVTLTRGLCCRVMYLWKTSFAMMRAQFAAEYIGCCSSAPSM
jgi:hypothetical protein